MENEKEIWFGHTSESSYNMPLCMIQIIDDEIKSNLKKLKIKSKLGQYILTGGNCQNIKISEPFDNFDFAINTACEKYGVDRFIQPISFHFA